MVTVTSIEIVEVGGERFVVSSLSDGSVVRKPVNENNRPTRRPRRPRIKLDNWAQKPHTKERHL